MSARDNTYVPGKQWNDEYYSSFDGLTEFQDICRYCYNFNSLCLCACRSDGEDPVHYKINSLNRESKDEEDVSPMRSTEAEEFNDVQIVFYSSPCAQDTNRCDIDTEEYNLKARVSTSIPSKESKAVLTNIIIQNKGDNPFHSRKLEVQNRIKSGWLSETYNAMLVLKTGTLSPCLSGDLYVKIYNKTDREIVVSKGSPIGILQSKHYEYC